MESNHSLSETSALSRAWRRHSLKMDVLKKVSAKSYGSVSLFHFLKIFKKCSVALHGRTMNDLLQCTAQSPAGEGAAKQ